MKQPKRAIVDVDGTLWSLWTPVRASLIRHGLAREGEILEEATSWNYHREIGISDEQFYSAVHIAHANQIMYEPFKGAYLLFDSLNKTGHEVIVASHRKRQTAQNLVKWLRKHGLEPYSGIYTGVDKRFLVNIGDLVIDDAPSMIEHCVTVGARSLALTWAYNQAAIRGGSSNGNPAPQGFHSLQELAKYVRTKC